MQHTANPLQGGGTHSIKALKGTGEMQGRDDIHQLLQGLFEKEDWSMIMLIWW